MLLRMDLQELLVGPHVAVLEPEAGDHLRHHEAGAVALGLEAHEPVPDAGKGRQDQAIGQRVAAQLPGCVE